MNPRTIIVLALGMLLARFPIPVIAQQVPTVDQWELRELCNQGRCRTDVVTRFHVGNGQIQEERIAQHRPAILPGSLSIMLGEELKAVAEFTGGTFQRWREPERRESSRNIVLEFRLTQLESDGSISLQVKNNGREPVKLDLFIRTAGAAQAEYTSSCPVLANGTVFEYWSQPIVEVVVGDVRVVSDDGALQCQ